MAVKRVGVLTSGGDASGMNAAVRAIVRTGLDRGLEVWGIYEGFRGLIEGGDKIRPLSWNSVGGIIHRGGTIIGSARSERFRSKDGRLKAARNLVAAGIDSLIVIGGDGSLTGADVFRREWPDHISAISGEHPLAADFPSPCGQLTIVGLVGSIDNDFIGTDMTIGADTALHRITEAIDAICSTASSHQRTFIVEVMGRHCGYLALMGTIATGADAALIPECPPTSDDWSERLVAGIKAGREAGRRDAIVVLAEGATDHDGEIITSARLLGLLEKGLGEAVRVTVLGHVQRGGSPSAFDRNLGTRMGHAAIETLLGGHAEAQSQVIGIRGNRVVRIPLAECVAQTRDVNEKLAARQFESALALRGRSFNDSVATLNTLLRALPHPVQEGQRRFRVGVMHAGAPAPGMNTAVRAAVRLTLDQGHRVFGIRRGFAGLAAGDIHDMNWMSVNGWAGMGGAELGTGRVVPAGSDLYAIARAIDEHGLEALLVVGGWEAYESVHRLFEERPNFPAFNLPIVCLPATIDNNLPGTELSIGADTALNNIVGAVDKIKQSAVAERRCFVVEVMGKRCGYLALMGGLATGAERVYLHEEGVTLQTLETDVRMLIAGFTQGKRLGLMIRNEDANTVYDTVFMGKLFEQEGGHLFDVRQSILGHLQQGGDPSPFDRIQATRLARLAVEFLIREIERSGHAASFVGSIEGQVEFHSFEDYTRMIDAPNRRPKNQWWLDLRNVNDALAQPAPRATA
ncbi:MAG: 6-phosphofructokinase [Acidobacteria bacterium]|nr:6-phosphofructokinase [Acidobacteriota bacterium]